MLFTIQNDSLSLTVDSLGAQMMHLQCKGKEYLWQGDPAYWPDRAPVLFPFVGRLTEGRYRLCGQDYSMGIHGFAAQSEFTPIKQAQDRLTLELKSNPKTQAQYPFAFSFDVTYQLSGNYLEITYRVHNESHTAMPFGLGGHPGFRVPLESHEAFEDYYLEFSQRCQPDRIGFTPAVFLSGHDEKYPLEDGRLLPLRHGLFDDDAIILKNMARSVTLRSKKSANSVTVSYPQMPYLGLWHWPKTDAPYLCIEPWASLPARQDVIEEFTCKSDLICLPSGKTYENTWRITVSQGE